MYVSFQGWSSGSYCSYCCTAGRCPLSLILHIKIKSGNISFAKNSNFYSPILVDFGKACLISEAKTERNL